MYSEDKRTTNLDYGRKGILRQFRYGPLPIQNHGQRSNASCLRIPTSTVIQVPNMDCSKCDPEKNSPMIATTRCCENTLLTALAAGRGPSNGSVSWNLWCTSHQEVDHAHALKNCLRVVPYVATVTAGVVQRADVACVLKKGLLADMLMTLI